MLGIDLREPTGGSTHDIWVAPPSKGGEHKLAENIVRFASQTDCDADPTDIYVKMTGRGNDSTVNKNSETLFVHAQHRGVDRLDRAVAITQEGASSKM